MEAHMHDFDENLAKMFNAPICPVCATPYDPKHYDFDENRACCSNCHTHYDVPADHVPDIPDDMLDIGDIWDD